MNISEINEQIRIEDFLASEGYRPKLTKKSGGELWYCSPLRNESKPSFKVDTFKNVWYDYADGKGGKLIALCMELKKMFEAKEAVYFFNEEYKGGISSLEKIQNHQKKIAQNSKENSQILREIKPVKNIKLWDYLRERKIDFDIAKKYLTEVHYQSDGRDWYALGFKCDKGGYELRSAISKRNINGKNITTFKNGSDKVKVFEGFFDFLSYASEHKDDYLNYDYVILNSSAFLVEIYNNEINNEIDKRNENYLYRTLENYQQIDTYFDNDDTGRKITHYMKEIFGQVNDFSLLYKNYEDYNQFCTQGRINEDFTSDESAIHIQTREIQEQEKKDISISKYSFFNKFN